MHFVDTEKHKTDKITNYLKKQGDNYKKRLVRNKAKNKKAKPYGWANKIVQEPLSKCFKQNCGYCGTRVLYNKNENEGDIDHFNPKSKVESDIFLWSNYVWSCKVCNQNKKKDYYDVNLMILDPTNKTDCEKLAYNKGRYYIKPNIENFLNYKKRLGITEEKTRINSDTNITDREILYDTLNDKIRILIEEKEEYDNDFPNIFEEKKAILIKLLKNSSFKFLIKDVFFPKLQKKYPSFTEFGIKH